MKICVIGFGSIGKRHYRNLTALGYTDVSVYDVDPKRIDVAAAQVKRLDQKTLAQFDVVCICNPNDAHIPTAIAAAKAGCHLFIEKPLSHQLKGLAELKRWVRKRKLITLVGCNMRFHPCLQFLKSYLDSGKLGKVYSIALEFGSYLPGWRPGQDYRKNFAARRATGGGIILDDIHEFDLLFWLNNFEKVVEHNFVYGKLSALQIETEDTAIGAFRFKNKILGSVRCDYLQQAYSRNCKIVGEKGNLEWNFTRNAVVLKNKEGEQQLFAIQNFDFNTVYIEEMKYFFSRIRRKLRTFNEIDRAEVVTNYCIKK